MYSLRHFKNIIVVSYGRVCLLVFMSNEDDRAQDEV